MAAAHAGTDRAARRSDNAPCIGGPARPLVAVHPRDRGARHRVDVAAPPGTAVVGLWTRVGRFFTGPGADRGWLENVQRQLVQADFGVAATNETGGRPSRADYVGEAPLE